MSLFSSQEKLKAAEKAFNEFHDRYETIVRNMGDAVMVTNGDGIITYLSPSCSRVLGYSPEELVGKQPWIIHSDDITAVKDIYFRALKGEEVNDFEYRVITKNGETKWINHSFSLKKENGAPIVISTIKDVTVRKQLDKQLQQKNRQLEEASQAKSDFLASMAHELHTPLNAIIGFSELLRDGVSGDVNEEQQQCCEEIMNGGYNLLELINDVLDVAKVEAGRIVIKTKKISIADVIREAAQSMRPLLEKKNLNLEMNFPEVLPMVYADSNRLRQVILNLLSNAIKFTPEGGSITVTASNTDTACQVNVTDTGIGIRENDKKKIFEPFIQAETLSEHQKDAGTGLGLKLSQQFIELMGGQISVKSQLHKGSTFYFTLPTVKDD